MNKKLFLPIVAVAVFSFGSCVAMENDNKRYIKKCYECLDEKLEQLEAKNKKLKKKLFELFKKNNEERRRQVSEMEEKNERLIRTFSFVGGYNDE